ncbi:MAG: HDOD domain-containing protein [Ignavibacteriaceae bacterium]|nr:HDOD domain-containing protein [Ignavibacteriaceae bacterium]
MINLVERQSKREKTELVLMNIYNLPPIPKVMQETIQLLENKNTRTNDLTKVIIKDQSLVAKILTIANSPLYGLQRKVTSIDFALLVLGFSEIKNIVSVLSMMESFKNKTDNYLDQKKFWLHSFLTGSVCKRVADDLQTGNGGEAFIAGFLHDMGISVMHRFFHSNFVQVVNLVNNEGISYAEAEIEIFGLDHQEMGYFLVDRWNFPKTLSSAISHHHNPEKGGDSTLLASVVHFGDYMTQYLQIGNFEWDTNLQLNEVARKILGFETEEAAAKFIDSYKELFESQKEAARFLS